MPELCMMVTGGLAAGGAALEETALYSYAVTPGVGQVFLSPEQLQAVAAAAGPGGRVEMNAFMQLIVHTPDPDLDGQAARLRALGLGVYPVGRVVKNLQTCTFCMGERVEGLPDALRLDDVVAGTPVPFTVRVGFSGCQNNCGEAILRDVGVVRMPPGVYDLYVGGKPGSLHPVLGRKVAEGVPADRLVAAVQATLDCYRRLARGKERFWKTVQRVGPQPFAAAAADAAGLPAAADGAG